MVKVGGFLETYVKDCGFIYYRLLYIYTHIYRYIYIHGSFFFFGFNSLSRIKLDELGCQF